MPTRYWIIKNKAAWGYVFRFGALEVPEADFQLIAGHMLPEEPRAYIMAP